MGFIPELIDTQSPDHLDGAGWLTCPERMDDAGRRNLPTVSRLICELGEELDQEMPPRAWMAGRFQTVLKHLAAGSQDHYVMGPLVLRASATTWAYVAAFYRNGEWVAQLHVGGTL
ncbi:hypothetical protein [Cupriavidus malaysiensis]|uniref:Uncharacterized protein n=1 Tax=Cupriavidus malaysiensis TaxID=367825 RepID=A0ABN4TLH7_9BURK|nr:hypothetical protein [Cupriavidus malaysiensis]AOZ05860.1 hypothetical protein BKK80_08550 [Cupriavidus malaysiensis]